tara:strand:- start:50 stop:1075 length:1026 start_codon:yes stop_codon:yes gene_type:complete
MNKPLSNVRTLIPFTGGKWQPLIENEIFSAIVKNPPKFWGISFMKFCIFDMSKINFAEDGEDNEARASGTRLKKKDLENGWDVTQKPLIVVNVDGQYYLWDGFNRWTLLDELGEITAPVWLYHFDKSFNVKDVKEHVQLSANNHPQSDEAKRRDYINTGLRWAKRNNINDLDEIIDWVNGSEHQFGDRDVNKIAASILVESETTNVRHIPTGSAAKSEAYSFLDIDLEYGSNTITNPIVVCTKEIDYIKDAFVTHMRNFVQNDEPETTEIIGYTKGCETEQEVIKQREDAIKSFEELDKLVCKYAYLKSQLNGKLPYAWKGFLPQLYGKECGDGIAKKLIE